MDNFILAFSGTVFVAVSLHILLSYLRAAEPVPARVRKGLFLAALLALSPALVCVTQAADRPAKEKDVTEVLRDIRREVNKMEEEIVRRRAGPAIQNALAGTRQFYRDLRMSMPSNGKFGLLRQYCEAGNALIERIEENVRYSAWDGARTHLAQLELLNDDIKRDFKEGLFSKFK